MNYYSCSNQARVLNQSLLASPVVMVMVVVLSSLRREDRYVMYWRRSVHIGHLILTLAYTYIILIHSYRLPETRNQPNADKELFSLDNGYMYALSTFASSHTSHHTSHITHHTTHLISLFFETCNN